jgi:hypothetical protein
VVSDWEVSAKWFLTDTQKTIKEAAEKAIIAGSDGYGKPRLYGRTSNLVKEGKVDPN